MGENLNGMQLLNRWMGKNVVFMHNEILVMKSINIK